VFIEDFAGLIDRMFQLRIYLKNRISTKLQGRLYLPKEVREKYGERYHIVEYEDRIELIPVADDPLAAVRSAAGELRDASTDEVRENIEAEARADAADKDVDR